MPKLKSLEPLETKPFKVKIKKVKYFEYESKSKFAPDIQWIANCNCLIIKAGKESKNKSYCNVQFYLNEEDYNNKAININDIVLLSDKVTWEVKKGVVYKTYNTEKLKGANAKEILVDINGKKYTEDFIYPYVIKAKEGTWKTIEKYDEYFIAKLGITKKIDLIFDTEKELINFENGSFYLEQDEFETIENYNNSTANFIGYAHKKKILEYEMYVDIKFDEEIEKWLLKIEKI